MERLTTIATEHCQLFGQFASLSKETIHYFIDHFSKANQQMETSKVYSLTQSDLTVNGSDWQILAGNEERIVIYCLTRAGSFYGVSKLVNFIFYGPDPCATFLICCIFFCFFRNNFKIVFQGGNMLSYSIWILPTWHLPVRSCTVGAEVNTQESLSTVTQRYDFKKRCKDTIKSICSKDSKNKNRIYPVRGLKEVEQILT